MSDDEVSLLLDVGGGTGNHAQAMREDGWEVTVVDRSAAMLIAMLPGRVAVMAWAREDIADSWTAEYWPSSRTWMIPSHPRLHDLLAWLPGATRTEVRWTDLSDGTLAALESHPELVLDPAWRMQTSFFERMQRDHTDELDAGLARLAADVAVNHAPRRQGGGSLLAWVKPD